MSKPPVLETRDLSAGYGGRPVISGIGLQLRTDEILCMIGHNGAGKSTLLKCLFGLMQPQTGEIRLDGEPVTAEAKFMVERGVALVPEGRGILPAIREFYNRRAGTLSGGQQQMVSIGRALLSRPRILLLDEPSIGLAPKLFQDLLRPIAALQKAEGLSILLVEQNVREALKIADRAVVMKSGGIVWEGAPAELADNRKLMELY
jgi:branched-chain amino acid transport system ATP-binding protein